MNSKAPTGLLLGRFQPFHDGHRALALEIIARDGQVCFAVRDTGGTDDKNPYDFLAVRDRIVVAMADQVGKFRILQVPNITTVYYGRDVGYTIEQLNLSPELQAISATKIRAGGV